MTEKQAIPLRFCKESNDLLHPQEDKKTKKLMYVCRNCDYTEEAESNCVYRNVIDHKQANKTIILQDVTTDPTLPRTRDTRCPHCENREAVFFSITTSEGMNLYYQCTAPGCNFRWKDEDH